MTKGKVMFLQHSIYANLDNISHIILDVDGTLTGGEIIYGENRDEYKIFSVYDGLALTIVKHVGLTTVVLSGRESASLRRRCYDLKIEDGNLGLGIDDKYSWLQEYMKKNNISSKNVAYVGDDLNDYAPMQLASFKACPQNAVDEIKTIAHYVATKKGGDGAVREVIETVLRIRGEWDKALEELYSVPNSAR